jgi:hypothetical protein
MAARKRSAVEVPAISIEVDGVSPKTPLIELTVSQFVQVLAQTLSQVLHQPRHFEPKLLGEVLERIRQSILRQPSARVAPLVSDQIRDLQLSVLRQVPHEVRRTLGRRGKAGRKS